VPWNEPGSIMRALDAGAEGVIVPMVNTPEEARAAAGASRYPPLGYRSWGPLRSGMAQPDFNPALGNEQTICLVMIETYQAVDDVDAILDVPGVDGVFVGPNDLAISHSGANAGAGTSERDVEMIERVAGACARRGLVAGISCTGPEDARRWERAGYSLLGMPSDAGLLGEAMLAWLTAARGGGGR
jgi:4-hydroxy-2-oxoheptanedioate aldolase